MFTKKLLIISATLLFTVSAYAQVVTTSNGKPLKTSSNNIVTIGPASRVSMVATSTTIPNNVSTTASESCMTRKAHYNRSKSSRFAPIYVCWYDAAVASNTIGTELGPGNACSIKSWIEYPSGTYTQVTFSGNSGYQTIASAGQLQGDWTTISIPNGAEFWTWTYITGSGGNNFPLYSNLTNFGDVLFYNGDEAAKCNTSGVPTSPSGSMTDNFFGRQGYFPAAILGDTTQPTFGLGPADSRTAGSSDIVDATHDIGNLARAVGPVFAYTNLGVSGDRMAAYFSSHAMRETLITAVNPSALISQLGTNEFDQQSASNAQWEGIAQNYMAHLVNSFPNIPIYRTTMEPWDSSSDNYATPLPVNWGVNCGNQTGQSFNATQTTENQHIRSKSFDSIPYVDIALGVLTAQDSGCWKANGIAKFFTPEGGHETAAGNQAIAASGLVNARAIAATAPISYSYPSLSLSGISSPTYSGSGPFSSTVGLSLSGGTIGYYYGLSPGVPPATIECWAYISSTPSGNAALPCQSGGQRIYIQASTGYAGFTPGNGSAYWGTTAVTTGTWHDFELDMGSQTLGGNVYYTLFLDGTQVAQTNYSTSSTQWPNTSGVKVGDTYFAGYVAEVSVWNTVRHTTTFTPPTSAYLGTESGLVGLWHLNSSLAGVRGPAGM